MALTGRAALAALVGVLVVLAFRERVALLGVDALMLAAIAADMVLAARCGARLTRSGDTRIRLGEAGTVTLTIATPAAGRCAGWSGTPGGRAPRPHPVARRSACRRAGGSR